MGRRRRNRHHLRPKCRGGRDDESNLLLIYTERHEMWHKLFGERTLEEVLRLLRRVKRRKDYLKRKEARE